MKKKQGRCPNLDGCPNLPDFTLIVVTYFTRILRSRNNRLGRRRRSLPPAPEVVTPPGKSCLYTRISYDFLVTVKAAPHECVIRTGLPWT